MIEQPYPYFVLKEKTHFFFESVGEKSVYKVVQFSPLEEEENIWNLGFGDLTDGGFIDDTVITNNQDAHKVLRTVAKIAIDFLAQYPDSTLEIKPVDRKRQRLYNGIFQRFVKDIDPLFKILGIFGTEEEIYSPLKIYDKFRITSKS